MNRSDDVERFSKILTVLKAIFDKELSPMAEDAYFATLEDLSIEQVDLAAQRAARTCKFFPKPAELRELVEGSAGDEAAAAWEKLQEAFCKAGAFTSVLFEDGAIAVAMESVFGSWAQFCEALHPVYRTEEVSYAERQEARLHRQEPAGRLIQAGGLSPEMIRARQKDFFDAYRRARRASPAQPRYVRGHCEIENVNTAASWTKGVPVEIDGRKTLLGGQVYVQDVVEGRTVAAGFDYYSGELLTPLLELTSRAAVPLLPPKREDKLLPPGPIEMVDPEEAKQILRDAIAGLTATWRMSEPKPDAERAEWEALIREQAEKLKLENQEGDEWDASEHGLGDRP